MANNPAPQIPNLSTLRAGGTSRGRGPRRRGGPISRGGPSHDPQRIQSTISQADRDRLIEETDSDANVSRLSAVVTGCLEDEFAGEFGASAPHQPPVIRQPIINRGTYVRTTAIDKLLMNILETASGSTLQIISLGSGTDTRPFRFFNSDPQIAARVLYHEFDFPTKSAEKFGYMYRSGKIREEVPGHVYGDMEGEGLEEQEGREAGEKELMLEDERVFDTFFRDNEVKGGPVNPLTDQWGWWNKSSGYVFHPCDLRDFHGKAEAAKYAQFTEIRRDLTTVLVSECCLCYMSQEESDAVIKWFSDRISTLGIVLYEPCKPNDAFGQMMSENLASRGLSMPSIKVYDSLEKQCQRLKTFGFDMFQEGASIDWLWEEWVNFKEHIRLSKILMVDEEEEWKLLAGHYLVVWAAREAEDSEGAFAGWDELEGEVERALKDRGPSKDVKAMGSGKIYH